MKYFTYIVYVCMASFFASSSLFAYDFRACEEKSALSLEKVGEHYAVAVQTFNHEKAKLFLYSPNSSPKGYNILKHDPFVGMYLLESKNKLLPVVIREITPDIYEEEIASVIPNDSVSGKLEKRMQSPIDFAALNTPTFSNSLISTVCDHIYGIGIGENKFIEKRYLDRFLQNDDVYYGDIGIRVFENNNHEVEVNVIDPFFKQNPFKYGDIIISIEEEIISNMSDFHRVVFDLEEGKKVSVKVKRDNAFMNLNVEVDRRRGGMLLPENFFGRVGLEVSDDFVITAVSSNVSDGFNQLKVGDKVLKINKMDVPHGLDAIIHLLGELLDVKQHWLISRNNFDFFLTINKENDENVHESKEIREYF
ncbi:MAG: PDZ domain-containing protein [Helicobacter sp.]|nr:PDZ domain-containing protein [Helicobacter sp.]